MQVVEAHDIIEIERKLALVTRLRQSPELRVPQADVEKLKEAAQDVQRDRGSEKSPKGSSQHNFTLTITSTSGSAEGIGAIPVTYGSTNYTSEGPKTTIYPFWSGSSAAGFMSID